jgi:hypothetical protein
MPPEIPKYTEEGRSDRRGDAGSRASKEPGVEVTALQPFSRKESI